MTPSPRPPDPVTLASVPQSTLNVPSGSVREVATGDGAVLLDMRQGICLSMTSSAINIWRMLKHGYSPQHIVDSLALDFPAVPPERIQADVNRFVAALTEKGLLVASEEPAIKQRDHRELLLMLAPGERSLKQDTQSAGKAPRFLVGKALFALAAYDLFRFGANFIRIHNFVRSWGIASPSAFPEIVERVCRAVNYACVWYPKRVLCLQRSAVTTCLLRSCGVEAEMVIGAQKCPFKAHAWTEVNGRPINERRDVRAAYLVWERC